MSFALGKPGHRVQWLGLFLGPLAAVLAMTLLPDGYHDASGSWVELGRNAHATVGMLLWMAIWWLTEAIEISATALLPVAMFPVLGVASPKAAAAPYASELIFLFLGGFLIAFAMQRWGLDQRFALWVLRGVGPRPAFMVAGFMAVTAVLSAFVSNTATAAMMLPIALSVMALVDPDVVADEVPGTSGNASSKVPGTSETGFSNGVPGTSEEALGTPETRFSMEVPGTSEEVPGTSDDASDLTPRGHHFSLCLMLGIAYSASIGGMATLIGTPPNGIMAQFVRDQMAEPYRQEIGFARWMIVGVPLALVFLPLVWWLLTKVLYPIQIQRLEGGRALIDEQLRRLGPPKTGEWVVATVFVLTAVAWITRPWLQQLLPGAQLSDAGIAMLAGVALFVIPVRRDTYTFALDWATARQLPWGVLVLFGGGLSLAAAVRSNGVAEFIGSQVLALEGAPTWLLILAVTVLVIFLTELTSNTATVATLVPILAAVAVGLGIHPLVLVVPATLASSCAFMMPVATPPNAIVFASGRLTLPQMARAGLVLNLVGVVLVMLLTHFVVLPMWGGSP